MFEQLLPVLWFIFMLVALFFLSRMMLNYVFRFFYRLFGSKNTVFWLLSFLFLPGTVVHEISHFFAALILFLPVHEVKIIPEWEHNHITLGRVMYEKKDMIRGVLVGIAPFFGALFFFWCMNAYHLFPSSSWLINSILGYVVFTVSSQMFSSKQDLVDLIYLIPIGIIVFAVTYLLGIQVQVLIQEKTISLLTGFLQQVHYYILLSLLINIILILIFRILDKLIRI